VEVTPALIQAARPRVTIKDRRGAPAGQRSGRSRSPGWHLPPVDQVADPTRRDHLFAPISTPWLESAPTGTTRPAHPRVGDNVPAAVIDQLPDLSADSRPSGYYDPRHPTLGGPGSTEGQPKDRLRGEQCPEGRRIRR